MLLSLPLRRRRTRGRVSRSVRRFNFSPDFAGRLFVTQHLVLDPQDQCGERFLAANQPTDSAARVTDLREGAEPPRNRTENPQIKRWRRGVSGGSHRVTPHRFVRKCGRHEIRSHTLDSANCGQNYGQKITSSRWCAGRLRRCCGSWRRATNPSSSAGSSTPRETCPAGPTVATPCPLSRRACL
jgi:hypothetical protein